MSGDLIIHPWQCPFCTGGLYTTTDGSAIERCLHCSGTGLTDDPCGPAERAPRPPGVMRAPCADCAFRRGSPELENQGVQLPEAEPSYCHQGLPISASGSYTPVATFRGLPLGAMVCAGWWAMRTGEPLPGQPYREIPLGADEIDKRWNKPVDTRWGNPPPTPARGRFIDLEPGLVIDTGLRGVVVDGRRVALAPLEYKLLTYLTATPGQLRERADLLRALSWDIGPYSRSHVAMYVSRVRRKLGPYANRIVTIPRAGYTYNPAGTPPCT